MPLFLQWMPMFEVLFFNLLNLDLCSHRKYSLFQTIMGLLGFTAVFFIIYTTFARAFSISQGEGRLAVFGFLYFVPFRLLYKEKTSILFIITCIGWTYTLGVLSLAVQIVSAVSPGNLFYVLMVENLLFFTTIFPFSRIRIPRYVFVLEHVNHIQAHWYRYLILDSTLAFLLLFTLHLTFSREAGSILKILVILLLLATIYISYFILCRVVLDVLKINQLEKAALWSLWIWTVSNRSMTSTDI